jgi:hypothetical protein
VVDAQRLFSYAGSTYASETRISYFRHRVLLFVRLAPVATDQCYVLGWKLLYRPMQFEFLPPC